MIINRTPTILTAGAGTVAGTGQLSLPAANTIASNHIALSFENTESATSSSDTTNCATHAPHRNAYTGLAWDWFVGVHGGRAPYYMELLQAPSGMTVLEPNMVASGDVYLWDDDHCRLSWPSPTAGESTVEVQVTDQDGTNF